MAFDRKAYMKAWNKTHKEQKRLAAKKYYQQDPEKYRERSRKYRANNKEKTARAWRKYYEEHRDEISAQQKIYMKEYRAEHRKEHAISSAEQRMKHKDEYAARRMLNHAIRDGKVQRQACEECGAEVAEAHHDDYNRPLEVRWLCKACHVKWHMNNKPIRKKG